MLSIILPAYQAEHTIAAAIQSIIDQTLTDWELLIIDDGSTDRTPAIATRFAQKDNRIRVHPTPHGGVTTAFNHGLTLAQHPLIARADADDTSHPDRLRAQAQHLLDHPETDAVSCLVHFSGDHHTAGGYAHHVHWANRQLTAQDIRLARFIDLPTPNPTLTFRKKLITQHGPARHGHFPEDYELILRWLDAGAIIKKLPRTLYHWHDPPTRLTRTDPRYSPEAFQRCKAPYLANAIAQNGTAHRQLWIWGAGRPARKAARFLEAAWKPATGFIDIDPKKTARTLHGKPILPPSQLPPKNDAVIISYVGTRGAGHTIRQELLSQNRRQGLDFWIAA